MEILLVVVIFGGFAGLFLFFHFNRKKKVEALAREATLRGWESLPLKAPHFIYHFSGNNQGISWEMKAHRPFGRSSGSVQSRTGAATHWSSSAVTSERLLLVAPLPAGKSVPPFGGEGFIANYIIPFILKLYLGEEVGNVAGIRSVDLKNFSFGENIACLSDDPEWAQAVLSRGAGEEIQRWTAGHSEKENPVIIFWKKSLQLRFGKSVTDFLLLDAIVNFGARLAKKF